MTESVAPPPIFTGTNLSLVWLDMVRHAVSAPNGQIRPLVATVTGFKHGNMPNEDVRIRSALDDFLARKKKWSVEIVAFTIFPQRYWQICEGDRDALYQVYKDALPHIRAANRRINGRGLYFERLINYGKAKRNDNQLEFAIKEYLTGRPRTSKYQASIYDPTRDQSREPYQTFPCLHSVSFVPTRDGLVLNGFYAMQYLVQKAYGNLLGLSHLGAFMALAMGMPLAEVNLVAGVEKLDFPKQSIVPLLMTEITCPC